jgi:hypothetical protein
MATGDTEQQEAPGGNSTGGLLRINGTVGVPITIVWLAPH